MILTVTANPSLDLLFRADRLVWEDANRVAPPRRRPGGQGVNVVRAVRALDPGGGARAIVPLGGATGAELAAVLDAEGTPLRAVPIDGETRFFVGVREEETGRSLLLNPRGPTAAPETADALLAAVEQELARAPGGVSAGSGRTPWLVACGSLLPGLPPDFYARVGQLARERGARFVPDCDGPALAAAAPLADLLVPNDMEAERLAGQRIGSPAAAVAAARSLLDPERGAARRAHRVVVTLGDRGAVSVSADGAWWARPDPPASLARELAAGTAVGAGDAFLAALLLAEDAAREGRGAEAGPVPGRWAGIGIASQQDQLREAVAVGSAALLSTGAALVTPADVARVRPHVVVEPLR